MSVRPACSLQPVRRTAQPRAVMAFSAHRRPPPPESPIPEDWIARIRAGDESAFERLFRKYYDPLCRHVAGYLGNRDAAEDVVQGVFARIWDDRAHWAVRDLRHYLYAAVSRGALSQHRRAAVRRPAAPLLMQAGGRPTATVAAASVCLSLPHHLPVGGSCGAMSSTARASTRRTGRRRSAAMAGGTPSSSSIPTGATTCASKPAS